MSCHHFTFNGGRGIITLANIFKYKGYYFEWHYWCGPMKLKKDLEPAARMGRKFFKIATEWNKLTDKKKEKTRIYG